MDVRAIFGLSVLFSFAACGLVAKLYIWPALRDRERNSALLPLVVFHTCRFLGLSFVVKGVVSPALPQAFAAPAAYGDLVAAFLAVASAMALSRRWPGAILLVWVFNIWGTADLLNAFYQGLFAAGIDASMLGAAFYIPTALVPALFVTHGMMFGLLLRRRGQRPVM